MKIGRRGLYSAILCGLTTTAGCRDGDALVVAPLAADPGYPEGTAVLGAKGYVSMPATFGNAGAAASRVEEIDLATGTILRDFVIESQNPSYDHALSGMKFDGVGRLYVLAVPGAMIRLTLGAHPSQQIYATFPDLPPCAVAAPAPCSPMPVDLPSLPNDMAFGPDGSAYVTDSLQATIFRVPPGGGEAQIWFQDPRLIAFDLGANGIAIAPDQRSLYFSVSLGGPTAGSIFRLPLVARPTGADLELFYQYLPTEGPDGLAFSRGGKLFVTLPGVNAVSVLLADGTEERRYTGEAVSRDGKDAMPFDAPATLTFVDDMPAVIMANHALVSRDTSHFAVLGLRVSDAGLPLIRPKNLP